MKLSASRLAKNLPWLMVIGGLIAMISSIWLSIEVFDGLKNPTYVPVCNLNPVLSCTSVADSAQSHAFGFPNYFLGIAGYATVAAIGAALLAGARLKRWFWWLVLGGMTFAVLFIHWLIFETLYRIGALCIFCMVVWVVTIPIYLYTKLYIIENGFIKVPQKLESLSAFARKYHLEILASWYIIIILLILKRFWYYWHTLI